MILDEAMYRGVGRWLTKRLGGNNWVKQIDYIYLLMGSASIVVSLNRLSMVTGKIEFLNDVGPPFAQVKRVGRAMLGNPPSKTSFKTRPKGNHQANTLVSVLF